MHPHGGQESGRVALPTPRRRRRAAHDRPVASSTQRPRRLRGASSSSCQLSTNHGPEPRTRRRHPPRTHQRDRNRGTGVRRRGRADAVKKLVCGSRTLIGPTFALPHALDVARGQQAISTDTASSGQRVRAGSRRAAARALARSTRRRSAADPGPGAAGREPGCGSRPCSCACEVAASRAGEITAPPPDLGDLVVAVGHREHVDGAMSWHASSASASACSHAPAHVCSTSAQCTRQMPGYSEATGSGSHQRRVASVHSVARRAGREFVAHVEQTAVDRARPHRA